MARMAAVDFSADWVAASSSLKQFFSEVPADVAVVSSARHDFVCLDPLPGPWHREMVYRKTVSFNHIGLPLLPKVAHRAHPTILVRQGNHEVGALAGRRIIAGAGLEIMHFPIRSRPQFENKIKNGGAAYARNKDVPKTVARGWRELYRLYCSEGSLASYLKDHCFTAEAVAAGLASGAFVIDTRVAEFSHLKKV